jgi:tetratricopeptide (TPR) repeat protein
MAANNLAFLLLEHGGDVNIALTMARTGRRGLPNLPNSADTLGWAYFQSGAYALAMPLIDQAVWQTPANATHPYHLGMACWKLNDIERARKELETSIKLNPDAPSAWKASLALSQIGGSRLVTPNDLRLLLTKKYLERTACPPRIGGKVCRCAVPMVRIIQSS